MSLFKKIILVWIAVLGVFGFSLFLPHHNPKIGSFISYSLQALLLILSLHVMRRERVNKNKFIFLNFSLFFGVSILFHAYYFVGTIFFVGNTMAPLYYFQYISAGLYFFLLAFAIGYLTIDLLFRDFKIFQKYLLALAIVGGFFSYYYHPYFSNPNYLYTTNEIREWKELDAVNSDFAGQTLSIVELVTSLSKTEEAPLLNRLTEDERLQRVTELYPYLSVSNYKILILKPIYLNAIYMCVLCVGLILLFFGYQYKKDPPQGAYIEKMMFLFLIFCTLEIFHAWSFVKAIEWQSFSDFVVVGQYLSGFVLALIAIFFALRLRFISSAKGDFYEQEIMESPAAVTRWRDALDNLVIENFFDRKHLLGRLFVDPNPRKSKN